MTAAMFDRIDVIDFLLERGARPDLQDASGMTALDAARTMGAARAVAHLQVMA
jgi:ankyrin repeat protein